MEAMMDQLPQGLGEAPPPASHAEVVAAYWRSRGDYLYYQYVYALVRVLGRDARSLIDVGSRNCYYLEWFDWIPRKLSTDLVAPYASATVEGRRGDFLEGRLDEHFDLALCLQVLEHVPMAEAFCARLLAAADHLIVSVPYNWTGKTTGHVHDPVDEAKLEGWMKRKPTYQIVVTEPLRTTKHRRLIAYYNVRNPGRAPTDKEFAARRPSRFL